MTTKRKLVFLFIFIMIGFVIFKITQKDFLQIEEKALKDYPIINTNSSASGTIESIYNPPKLRSSPFFVRINFRDGLKYTFDTEGYALNHTGISIRDVSKSGALLEKRSNSDTVVITNNGKVYKFLITHDD